VLLPTDDKNIFRGQDYLQRTALFIKDEIAYKGQITYKGQDYPRGQPYLQRTELPEKDKIT